MAVIRPQTVAGWDGNQKPRRPVGSDGAPCPVEFLHRKPKSNVNQESVDS